VVGSKKNGPAGARDTPGPSPQIRRGTVDTTIIRTHSPEVLPDETPHGCYEGFVYIGHTSTRMRAASRKRS
jgi:hypothetical protein